MIPHNTPLIKDEDREAVDSVLRSGWVAQGSQVNTLEANYVSYFDGGVACAVSSGTAALFLSLKGLGVGKGSKVAVPTYACSALLNAVFMAGAMPSVVDILPDSFCLDPVALGQQAADASCVIPVHCYGEPANISAMLQPGRKLIEDCCHSLGGSDANDLIGRTGDIAVFSFYATKIITGGQGGLIWANDPILAAKIHDYRQFDCREDYVPRFNLQMTDIQAALINSQMRRLKAIKARRQLIAKSYLAALPEGLKVQSGITDVGRMIYRFVVVTPDLATRDALHRHMQNAGVSSVIPINRYELLHRYLKLDPNHYPVAENLVETTLSLPIYPGLTEAQVAQVQGALMKFRP